MANRAQTYGLSRQTLRAVAANERKSQKRERKRKLAALRQYRKRYIMLLDLAMQGKELTASIGYSGAILQVFCDSIPIYMSDLNEWSKSKRIIHADEVRELIRKSFETRDGLKPWQMDEMEKP